MSLEPGTRLGDYEITAPLGAGGMGEVYRAQDTKLGREVAIKVLPTELGGDPERVARFEKEARSLAALSHPNVATLYGYERAGDVHFLAMELAPGEDLAERIARGPLGVDEAVEVFRQIAEGLEAAHARGVVHRDLKPANVKVDEDGRVKILDFGLAKATEADTSDTAASLSPTLTAAATMRGQIMGTAGYMSPEQARGKMVDQRTDIWAFGVCLLEALTGRSVFGGEDVSTTLAAVLRDEPDLDSLPSGTPAAVRRVLRRCLSKDPKTRWHSVADVRLELTEAGEQDPGTAATEPQTQRSALSPPVVWVLAAAALLAGLFLGRQLSSSADTARDANVRALSALLPTDPPYLPSGFRDHLAIAADGSAIAYRSAAESEGTAIYYRSLDSDRGRFLFSTPALAGDPVFSPSGDAVFFATNQDLQIKYASLAGGAPVDVAYSGAPGTGKVVAQDGTLYHSNVSIDRIERVSSPGADPVAITEPASEGEQHGPLQLIDDERALLFTVTSEAETQVRVLDLESGETKTLLRGASRARWLPPAHLVFPSREGLSAVAFDPRRREVLGEPVLVLPCPAAPDSGADASSERAGFDWTLAESGDLIYSSFLITRNTQAGGFGHSELVWVDREGNEAPSGTRAGRWRQYRVSPDGRKVAVAGFGPERGVWVLDFERGTSDRVATSSEGGPHLPIWSSDGSSLLFTQPRPGATELQDVMQVPADGATRAAPVTDSVLEATGAREFTAESLSPDGRLILGRTWYEDGMKGTVIDRTSGEIETLDLAGGAYERNLELSPDMRWLAFQSDRSGRPEVYIRPFPLDADRLLTVSTEGGAQPAWSVDGRELFFVAPDGALMAVSIDPSDNGLAIGRPSRLFSGPYTTQVGAEREVNRVYDVGPKAQRFLMKKMRYGEQGASIVMIENFGAEVRRKVPVD